MSIMRTVRIIHCGVPPGGWQTEFGVQGPEGLFHKSQGFVDGNTHAAAIREALRFGLSHYFDQNGNRIAIKAPREA
ncbi:MULTISPECIES: hypothetical protein [unclassified Methylocaldum]|jgi:hypothetical protein|uniref:hypothetical protein n=1 Tax=unclassified Methylocaldum TaxID=2622260 RepID=UPI000A321074|nr:hypothetical protein [Methylocaldum sp. RMAD-M]MBP1151371.1 hypothetical protein [Methylocaldum sp. RMAD-M]MVF23980.1 hypothetical protein [Methylocaldum sp. BRCS4]